MSYCVFVGNIENSLIEKISAVGARVVGQTVEIRGAKPVQLTVTLSHGWSTINGTAMHDGKPTAGAMILLVPDDPEINLPLFVVIRVTVMGPSRCAMCARSISHACT